MPKNFNHALRTAERAAVTDILSNCRYGLYCGRANTTIAMSGVNVDPNETLEQMEAGMALIRDAFKNNVITFTSKHYQIPPRRLAPTPTQGPAPLNSTQATNKHN